MTDQHRADAVAAYELVRKEFPDYPGRIVILYSKDDEARSVSNASPKTRTIPLLRAEAHRLECIYGEHKSDSYWRVVLPGDPEYPDQDGDPA